MAERSAFAMLLRSPWWYSFLIAGVLVGISAAVAQGQYLIFGATAALPLLVISGFCGFRQLQRPSGKRILEVVAEARKMRAREVADRIAKAYASERYKAVSFKGDAADLELLRGSRTLLLSCKRFKAATTGIEPLKQLVAAGEKAEATGYLYVTVGEISDSAIVYAKRNNIEFIQPDALAALFDGKAKIA